MNTTVDLRPAFGRMLRSYAPDDDPSPADDSAESELGDDDAAGEGDDDNKDDDKPSRIKQLSDEAAKNRHRAKNAEARLAEAEARIKQLEDANTNEALQAENAELKLRLAFNEACYLHKVSDRDAVWKLGGDDLKAIVDDEGKISDERLESVVQSIVTRYPHFAGDDETDEELPDQPSGRMMNGLRKSDAATSAEVLRKKFPALGR